jgi:hypothetical protein
MTLREAMPILLRLLAQGPKTQTEVRAAIPATNPIFVNELLTTAMAHGKVRFNPATYQYARTRKAGA